MPAKEEMTGTAIPAQAGIQIKKSNPSDIPAIEAMMKLCFPSRRVVVPDCGSLVIEVKSKIAACIFFRIVAGECEVIDICTHPEFQRKGLATKLLQQLQEEAKANAVSKMFLEVDSTNQAAMNLYKKHGFVQISLRKEYYHYLDGSTGDAIIMGKGIQQIVL